MTKRMAAWSSTGLLAWLMTASVALAAQGDTVSWTARFTCDYRAVAAQHPDPKLRNPDDLADRLCAPTFLPREYEAARDVIDVDPERYAGYFYVNARTHHIDRQLAAGYDPARPTLFILEGVTMYVSESGNDATFAFMGRHAAPGSVVVFD